MGKILSLNNAPASRENAPVSIKSGVVLHPPCPTTERLRMKAVNCHGLPHFAKSVVKRGRWY